MRSALGLTVKSPPTLLYAYARGQRSSRGIERACVEDIAFGVIAANQVPDHATIARFRQRHEDAIAELFGSVLGLCARAGMVEVGVIAIDATKLHANASQHANRDYERIARQILGEADEIDREEDARHGQARGDELPPKLATREGRERWCVAPSAISMSGAPYRPGRSRARAKRVCRRQSAAWMRSWRSNAQQTPPTNTTARMAARRTAGGSARHRSPTRRPPPRRGRST